jgi:SAM-dependent methyltransferase
MSSRDYLLGHREDEWDRLEAQHRLWRHSIIDAVRALELPADFSVLEVGCGPGALLEDLASLTRGAVGAVELDPDAAARTRARLRGRAEVRVGNVNEADLGGPWDVVVLRWVFSFLPSPRASLDRVWSATRTGGFVVVQDYHHDGLGIFPNHAAIDRVIRAYREAYRATGGDLWIGAKLVQMFAALGAETRVQPEVRAGSVDDEVWTWVERFLLGHLGLLLDGGHATAEEIDAFREAWEATRAVPGATLITPVQVTLVANKRSA